MQRMLMQITWLQFTSPLLKNVNRFHATDLFDALWKHQETSGFRMFLGGIKRDQWREMG